GEQRAHYTYNLNDKPSNNSLQGIPMRTTASTEGSTLVLTSKVADTKPGTLTEKWTLSSDGNPLTIERAQSLNGRDMQQTMVAEKQPDSAGEIFRKPEQTAAEHFKNIQILKEAPASQLLDTMRNFNVSLGVQCDFCHVQGKFDSDEKPTKAMARNMLTMTHNINQQAFNGRMEIRCYTCHKGASHPASHAPFE
ncbi:MAG: c-type cytochrome, partial [Acidobacteriaceae bacterium]|nr:c-type cytochrome [Acidobacteriaceae bacterium]